MIIIAALVTIKTSRNRTSESKAARAPPFALHCETQTQLNLFCFRTFLGDYYGLA